MNLANVYSALRLSGHTHFNDMLAICKVHLVEARRSDDIERAKLLSQVRAYIRRRINSFNHCIDCGSACKTTRCQVCAHYYKWYSKTISQPQSEWNL
jgi:hypothetical protein